MPIITDESVAFRQLSLMLQPSVEPRIDDGGIVEMLLDNAKRASIWEANKVFARGEIVIPATRNGHRYECEVGGTSGSDEPTWGTSDYAQVGDGDITWKEAGGEIDLWDLRQAAYEGWMMKAAKTSECYDYSSPSGSRSLDQRYKHCIDMAHRFAPIGVA